MSSAFSPAPLPTHHNPCTPAASGLVCLVFTFGPLSYPVLAAACITSLCLFRAYALQIT